MFSISVRFISTAPDTLVHNAPAGALANGRDVRLWDQDVLAEAEHLESKGLGLIVAGYMGNPDELPVEEDLRRWLIPVGNLDLSVRSMNCLRNKGIATVGELLEKSTEELLAIANMGRKSVLEIRDRLYELGIPLEPPRPPFRRSLDLRLLLDPGDIDPRLQSIALKASYSTFWRVCMADSLALQNCFKSKLTYLQVERAMKRIGLPLTTVVPGWLSRAASCIEAAFAEDLLVMRAEYAELAAPQSPSPAVVRKVEASANSLMDEIDQFILAGVKPAYKKILSTRSGWDGSAGATLEEVAATCGLTRERVRQIEKKLQPIRPSDGFRFLTAAIEFARRMAPCVAESAEEALWAENPSDIHIRIEGLLNAAEAVGLNPGFALKRIGPLRFIGAETDLDAIRHVERVARADISHFGAGDLKRVSAEVSSIAPATISHLLGTIPSCLWDPLIPGVFFLPTSRNTLLTRLKRILSVVASVTASVARTQILRDSRMEGSDFSSALLLMIAETQPWCRVTGEYISRTDGFETDNEDSNEAKIVALMRQHGPVIDSRVLQALANDIGISQVHVNTLLSNSPVLVKHGRALYGLVGSVFDLPQLESRSIRTPESVCVGVVSRDDGCAWSDPDAALSSADVSSNDFSIRIFNYVAEFVKRRRDDAPWSMIEAFGTPHHSRLLRAWGKEGNVDLKWLRSRFVIFGDEHISARNAVAVLFLAYSAEIARAESVEGGMWLQIRESLKPSIATELFFSNGNTRPWLREATEVVCRRLRVRHGFMQQGEMGWLRTVYLQFGMTRSGLRRLPYWLSGYNVPVAVEDLLDRSSDTFSSTFTDLWQILGDFRVGACSESEARKRLATNSWAGPALADDMLEAAIQRREIVRTSESEGQEAVVDIVRSLFSPPKLLWRQEPEFELALSPDPPSWLEDSTYVIVLGDGQRIPIRRVENRYETTGAEKSIFVSARSPSITVDVLHRRTSILPEKIEIDFRPADSLAFYRLSDGKLFGPWDELPRGTVPVAVLHPASSELDPPARDYSIVLGGEWCLSAYRSGLPPDLRMILDERIAWQRVESSSAWKESAEVSLSRIHCDGGRVGDRQPFEVVGFSDSVRLIQAVIDEEVCMLTTDAHGHTRGTLRLTPASPGAERYAKVITQDGNRFRAFRVPVNLGEVTGAAFDHFGRWAPLIGVEVLPVYRFKERLFAHPPAVWRGETFVARDWAILAGDRILDRPSRRGHELASSLHGLGEELRLAVEFRGEWWRGFKISEGIVDTGVIRTASQSNSTVRIELLRDIEIREQHDVWVWFAHRDVPTRLAAEGWRVQDSEIIVDLAGPDCAVCVALSYNGHWLGAVPLGTGLSWFGFKPVLEETSRWVATAGWLRWFRVPALLPALRSAVLSRVQADPAGTFLAWTVDAPLDARAVFSEEHRERWARLVRSFISWWSPNETEAVRVLRALDLLPKDPLDIVLAFERTGEGWLNADSLARIDPGVFATLVSRSLPLAYTDAGPEERAVLVKILRKQLMGTDQELTLDQFSARIGLDRRFASDVLRADSLRRERSLTLRIALNDYSVRQFVCVRLLDEALLQGVTA